MLSGMDSVISARSDIFITGKAGFQLLELVVLAFLGAEYLKIVEEYLALELPCKVVARRTVPQLVIRTTAATAVRMSL